MRWPIYHIAAPTTVAGRVGRLSVERRIGQRPSAGCEVVGDAGDVYMEGGLLD
jgi:hypothetical protein